VPVALYLTLVFAYPIAFNLWLSFQSYGLKSLITGVSEFVGLDNFTSVLNSTDFLQAARNTAVFAVASIAVQFVIGFALALFFYNNFPLSRTVRSLLVLPWQVPAIVSTTAWRFLFAEPNGFINQVLSAVGLPIVPWLTSPNYALVSVTIVNIWIGIAFNLVLLHSGLQSIPTERFEAAAIDGATGWKRLRYVTVPALRPVTAIVFTLGLVYTLRQFDLIWTLTQGGPGNASQLLSTWSYTNSFVNNQFGLGAAVADCLFFVSGVGIITYTLVQRKQSRG